MWTLVFDHPLGTFSSARNMDSDKEIIGYYLFEIKLRRTKHCAGGEEITAAS